VVLKCIKEIRVLFIMNKERYNVYIFKKLHRFDSLPWINGSSSFSYIYLVNLNGSACTCDILRALRYVPKGEFFWIRQMLNDRRLLSLIDSVRTCINDAFQFWRLTFATRECRTVTWPNCVSIRMQGPCFRLNKCARFIILRFTLPLCKFWSCTI
jgi:hypothetical protein